jgi:ATP-dependent helicase YprA (DUF1998 family)
LDFNLFIKELKGRKDLKGFVHHELIPPVPPCFAVPEKPLTGEVKKALRGLGIKKLYKHQSLGIDIIRGGRNVVAMTPTASGKSLIYNIPVVESVLKEPATHALYLFPLKGLEQDQLKAFKELTEGLPLQIERPETPSGPGACEIYDGDTTQYRRKKIRERPPAVVLTNPDMLHLAIIRNNRRDTHIPGGARLTRCSGLKEAQKGLGKIRERPPFYRLLCYHSKPRGARTYAYRS